MDDGRLRYFKLALKLLPYVETYTFLFLLVQILTALAVISHFDRRVETFLLDVDVIDDVLDYFGCFLRVAIRF